MRFLPHFLLILVFVAGTASATSTALSIEPGECEVYFVSGSSPAIDVVRGDLESQSILFLPPNLWRIELCCASDSETCEGWIHT